MKTSDNTLPREAEGFPQTFLWISLDPRWDPGVNNSAVEFLRRLTWISRSLNICKIFQRGRTASPKISGAKRWGRDKEQFVGTLRSLRSVELDM